MDNLSTIEDRVEKLERLVGHFEALDETKGLEILTKMSNKFNGLMGSSKNLASLVKNLNDVQKYVSLESIREIEDESLINSKIDLILSEELVLKKIGDDYKKLDEMVKILDNQSLNDVQKLKDKLQEISGKQASLKENQESFKSDLKDFLTIYSGSISSINQTIAGLNDYLDQFDKPLPAKAED